VIVVQHVTVLGMPLRKHHIKLVLVFLKTAFREDMLETEEVLKEIYSFMGTG